MRRGAILIQIVRQLTDMSNTKVAQDRLNFLDRQAVFMQQFLNSAQQQHIGRAVIAPTTSPFYGFDLRELTFPKAQNMCLHAEPVRDFADGAKGVR